MQTSLDKSIDLIATKLAEVRLSQLGYRFIPGIYPLYQRLKQFICSKAMIIRLVEVSP